MLDISIYQSTIPVRATQVFGVRPPTPQWLQPRGPESHTGQKTPWPPLAGVWFVWMSLDGAFCIMLWWIWSWSLAYLFNGMVVWNTLKNMKVSWDDYPQYMGKWKMFQTTNQLFNGITENHGPCKAACLQPDPAECSASAQSAPGHFAKTSGHMQDVQPNLNNLDVGIAMLMP